MIEKAAEKLDLPVYRLEGLLENKKIVRVFDPFPYFRFDRGIRQIETGTVIFASGEVIRGFPKIRRAMTIAAIARNFSGLERVVIEEKMNGYNVRLAKAGGKVYAFTRGGLICPYTTEKAIELIDVDFFEDNPELMLCGEMVGPDNPYVPKTVYGVKSVDFFIFDIKEKETGKSMPVKQRIELLNKYKIRSVKVFGEYEVMELERKVKEIIRKLGRAGREGIVVKDPNMLVPPIKYTSSESTCADLRYAFQFFNEYGQDFFFSRIIREGFQAVDFNESRRKIIERAHRLGESILLPMVESIKKCKEGKQIFENAHIRVRSLKTIEEFEAHLRRLGVEAIFDEPKRDSDGSYAVNIRKLMQSTTDKTKAVLKGQPW
ncbi:MAG: RNA ligase [Halobacteria archaeon]